MGSFLPTAPSANPLNRPNCNGLSSHAVWRKPVKQFFVTAGQQQVVADVSYFLSSGRSPKFAAHVAFACPLDTLTR